MRKARGLYGCCGCALGGGFGCHCSGGAEGWRGEGGGLGSCRGYGGCGRGFGDCGMGAECGEEVGEERAVGRHFGTFMRRPLNSKGSGVLGEKRSGSCPRAMLQLLVSVRCTDLDGQTCRCGVQW